MKQVNWKTIIAPIVTAGALLYGTITGHEVSQNIQNTITVDTAAVISFAITVWGIIKSHKKEGGK